MMPPTKSSATARPVSAATPLALLGICPLLAAATTLVTGIGLGLATLAVACATSLIAAATGRGPNGPRRVPALLVAMASLAVAVERAVQALFFELHLALGLFLPLIAINATILCRAMQFASGSRVQASLVDALRHGGGMALMLAAVGGLRELFGQGTLLAGAELVFGPVAADLAIHFTADGGLGLAAAPAGAFFTLAACIAARSAVRQRREPPAA
jgi:electron transport complex protein RnfE